MAKDGYYFLIPLALLAGILFYGGFLVSGSVAAFLACFVGFFFRDPKRVAPGDPAAVVSPADGKIILLKETPEGTLVSIFLSIFNVHVNRAPIEGVITRQDYRRGRFRAAFDDRASVENEQVVITLKGRRELTFSLIAGLVARRIVPWKKVGDPVSKGDRIALIRFGSRVDIHLPSDCLPAVRKGDRVRAGESVIAHWRGVP